MGFFLTNLFLIFFDLAKCASAWFIRSGKFQLFCFNFLLELLSVDPYFLPTHNGLNSFLREHSYLMHFLFFREVFPTKFWKLKAYLVKKSLKISTIVMCDWKTWTSRMKASYLWMIQICYLNKKCSNFLALEK